MIKQDRLAALLAAEKQADQLFDAIETRRLIRPGRTETEVDQDELVTLADFHGWDTCQLVAFDDAGAQLPRLSVPAADHPACRLVVSALHAQLPGYRGPAR
jgi:hypothetical protein